jgi:hypothetical protein
MKDINYHYNIINSSDVVYQFPFRNKHPFCHLGDKIAILNMHLYFNKILNLNGKLNISDLIDDELYIAKLFFKENVTNLPPNYLINLGNSIEEDIKILYEIYKNKYFKIDQLNFPGEKKYISYAYDGYSWLNEKIPPFFRDGIDELIKKFTNYEFVEVGNTIGLEKTIEYINKSSYVITIDNGISHLCRCMNTPYIIVKKKGWNETLGFPREYCQYTSYDTYEDMLNIKL